MDSDILKHPIIKDGICSIMEFHDCLDPAEDLTIEYQIITRIADINHVFRSNSSGNSDNHLSFVYTHWD